ncbi:MAG: hypothetical protein JST22_21610 [Bacteroidetes bacterium]|nr:hypothetical protein [Bacteroidota bacterium]
MTTPLNSFARTPQRRSLNIRIALFLAILATAAPGCSAGRTAITFDPAKTCGVRFSRPRGCAAEHDVTIEVDGSAVMLPDYNSSIVLTLHQGYHTFVQYVDRYEVRRWKDQPITADSYFTLECFGQPSSQEPRQQQKVPR